MRASSHLCVLHVSLFPSPLISLNILLLRVKIINRQDMKARPVIEDETVLGHGE
jgi:hypothetical protein